MMAAKGGHVETVVALIEHGAAVDLKGQVSCWSQQLNFVNFVHWHTRW